MRTSIVLGLAATATTASAFHLPPAGPKRSSLALRSTAPDVGATEGLSDEMIAQLQATAVAIDQSQQAQTLALLSELRDQGQLSEEQYASEVAKVSAGTAQYLKPSAVKVPEPPTLEMINALEAKGFSYLGALRALALHFNDEQAALASLERGDYVGDYKCLFPGSGSNTGEAHAPSAVPLASQVSHVSADAIEPYTYTSTTSNYKPIVDAGAPETPPEGYGTVVDGYGLDGTDVEQPWAHSESVEEATINGGQVTGQCWLEASPYYDMSSIPMNTYTNKKPCLGSVRSVKRIVGPKATGEICHIVLDHGGKMPYWEGQSLGILPPGLNDKGKPNKVRLYSIASSRYGDDMTGTTSTLCVRRATYWDEAMQAEDPAKKGVCSNFLCDATPGTEVKMTGPSGKIMLLPESDPNADIIMIATGTGIAPYRGFIRRLFVENTPARAAFKGLAWLFLGVANSDGLLYADDWQMVKDIYPNNFRVDYALSREQTNKEGGKMYIQDKVAEHADEIFERLDNGAHIYFCGLKGMMPGIEAMLTKVCARKGLEYSEFIKTLKSNGQWHVEVY